MLPFVIAGHAKRRALGELVVVRAAGTDRSVEEQRRTAGAGRDDRPSLADLVGRNARRDAHLADFRVDFLVRIVIMRFNPSDKLVVAYAVTLQIAQRLGVHASRIDCGTHGTTVL